MQVLTNGILIHLRGAFGETQAFIKVVTIVSGICDIYACVYPITLVIMPLSTLYVRNNPFVEA